jgi:hypothetical protein
MTVAEPDPRPERWSYMPGDDCWPLPPDICMLDEHMRGCPAWFRQQEDRHAASEPVPEPATDDDVIWQVERKQSADVGGRWVTTEFTKTAPNAPDEGFPPQRLTAYVPAARLAAAEEERDEAQMEHADALRELVAAQQEIGRLTARLAAAQQEIGRLTVRVRQEAAIGDTMADRALTAAFTANTEWEGRRVAEAEVARLTAQVARVEALCHQYSPSYAVVEPDGNGIGYLADIVRAALDDPPEEVTP